MHDKSRKTPKAAAHGRYQMVGSVVRVSEPNQPANQHDPAPREPTPSDHTHEADPDAVWRRPAEGEVPLAAPAPPSPAPEPVVYTGPPPTAPPPPGWRPPTVVEPIPPRQLPPQDQEAIDEAEQQALTITRGVGIMAAAIGLVLIFILCARIIS